MQKIDVVEIFDAFEVMMVRGLLCYEDDHASLRSFLGNGVLVLVYVNLLFVLFPNIYALGFGRKNGDNQFEGNDVYVGQKNCCMEKPLVQRKAVHPKSLLVVREERQQGEKML